MVVEGNGLPQYEVCGEGCQFGMASARPVWSQTDASASCLQQPVGCRGQGRVRCSQMGGRAGCGARRPSQGRQRSTACAVGVAACMQRLVCRGGGCQAPAWWAHRSGTLRLRGLAACTGEAGAGCREGACHKRRWPCAPCPCSRHHTTRSRALPRARRCRC